MTSVCAKKAKELPQNAQEISGEGKHWYLFPPALNQYLTF